MLQHNSSPSESFKVENFTSSRTGREVANQFLIVIKTDKGTKRVFQSYSSVIAIIDEQGHVTLDCNKWDYSVTTGKYRNQFLGEGIADTRKNIADGVYSLANLNVR